MLFITFIENLKVNIYGFMLSMYVCLPACIVENTGGRILGSLSL